MKTITIVVLCLTIFFSVNCLAKDLNRGRIIDNLDQKVKIITGDSAITNLGKKDGIIKGDILTIYKTTDTNYLDPIGRSLLLAIHARQSDFDLYSSLRVSLIRVTRRWLKLHHVDESFPFVSLPSLIRHSDRSEDEHV